MKINKKILKESVSPQNVIDAIKKRYEVKIRYEADDTPKGKGERIIQPVAYGLTKAGNPVIRAFQPYGDTKTKTPHWKMFRLDRIQGWKGMPKKKFTEPPGDTGAEGAFNPKGDNTMSTVYVIADFETPKTRYERGGLKRYNDERMNASPIGKFKRNVNKAKNSTEPLDYVKKNIEKYTEPKNPNYWSIYDMARAEAATNTEANTQSQTIGPIIKGEEQNAERTVNKNVDYTEALRNGPVYKEEGNDNKEPEINFDYKDDKEEDSSEENTRTDELNNIFKYIDDNY